MNEQAGKVRAAAASLPLLLAMCGQADHPPGYGLASAESKRELCVPDEAIRERIRDVLLRALDDALKDQIQHLFEIWMKDDTDQPRRARTGAENAMRAYVSAHSGAQSWAPPLCKPDG